MSRDTLTDTASAQPQQNKRLRFAILAACLTFCCTVIVGRLVYYQVARGAELKQVSAVQRIREKELPTRRGLIADVNGHVLALDAVEWTIEASPPLVTDAEEAAGALSALLGMPREALYERLTAERPWTRLAMGVDYDTGEAIRALELYGIKCIPTYKRLYPEAGLTAHLLGIVNNTGDGFYGVEGYYNLILKGEPGRRVVEQNPVGGEIPIPPIEEVAPEPGSSLILTIDRNIQFIAAEELQRALSEYGAESGTVMIMDPRRGAILAVVSHPTYDPNDFAEEDPALLDDPALSKQWEPGSIFKIITWSAGIDSGTISPGTTFYDDGSMEVGGRVIRNWDRQGHGLVTMSDGLVQSLNTVAAFVSTSMGKDTFYTYLRRFGFGTLTDVDLASEGPGTVKQPGDANWFPSELGTNSFGQGVAVTPMQMIVAVSAVANDGLLMKPYIVDQFITTDEEGRLSSVAVEPMLVRRAISRDTAETMTNMLVRVVEEGATEAQVAGYRIAGKTGTAQIPTAYGYHPSDTIASFVGYAPADDPQFIVLIKLTKPTESPWGSQTAAPTFRAIAERLFVYMQIPPDNIRSAAKLGTNE